MWQTQKYIRNTICMYESKMITIRSLDADLSDIFRLSKPDAEPKHLAFIRAKQICMAGGVGVDGIANLGAAEDAMLKAKFAVVKEEMQMDQFEHSSFQASVAAWEGRSFSAVVKFHEAQHDQMFTKIEELCDARFPFVVAQGKNDSVSIATDPVVGECIEHMRGARHMAYRIIMLNFSFLGHMTEALIDYSITSAIDLMNQNRDMSALVVLMPLTGFYGSIDSEDSVRDAERMIETKLRNPTYRLESRIVSITFDPASAWSPTLALARWGLLAINNEKDASKPGSPLVNAFSMIR